MCNMTDGKAAKSKSENFINYQPYFVQKIKSQVKKKNPKNFPLIWTGLLLFYTNLYR